MSIDSQNKIDGKFQNFFGCVSDVAAYTTSGTIEVLGNYSAYNEGIVLSTVPPDFYPYFALVLYDFRKVEVIDKIQFPSDYEFILVNSMVKHVAQADYNLRRESCKRVIECIKKKYLQVRALRDVSPEVLKDAKKLVDFTDYKRASHIVSENELVLKGIEALKRGDIELFGSYLYTSHESSRKDFENSCPELDYLIELSKTIPGCVGARLSGGGFGGVSIHLVKKEEADKYRSRIVTAFKLQTNIEPQTIVCGTIMDCN